MIFYSIVALALFLVLVVSGLALLQVHDLKTTLNKKQQPQDHSKQIIEAIISLDEASQHHNDEIDKKVQNIMTRVEKINMVLSGTMVKEIGLWGELQLKNMLETAGLVENVDFFLQTIPSEIKANLTSVLRPDCMLKIGNHWIIIDCKTPMKTYHSIMSAENKDAKQAMMLSHAKILKSHIRDLSNKNYNKLMGKHCMVVMFLPVEGLFNMAVKADPSVLPYALQHGINLATPVSIGLIITSIKKFTGILNFDQHSATQYKKIENIHSEISHLIKSAALASSQVQQKMHVFDREVSKIQSVAAVLKNIIDGKV